MSPSRFSEGMTRGSPAAPMQECEGRVDQLRLVGDVGCRLAASSISSFSIPS